MGKKSTSERIPGQFAGRGVGDPVHYSLTPDASSPRGRATRLDRVRDQGRGPSRWAPGRVGGARGRARASSGCGWYRRSAQRRLDRGRHRAAYPLVLPASRGEVSHVRHPRIPVPRHLRLEVQLTWAPCGAKHRPVALLPSTQALQFRDRAAGRSRSRAGSARVVATLPRRSTRRGARRTRPGRTTLHPRPKSELSGRARRNVWARRPHRTVPAAATVPRQSGRESRIGSSSPPLSPPVGSPGRDAGLIFAVPPLHRITSSLDHNSAFSALDGILTARGNNSRKNAICDAGPSR